MQLRDIRKGGTGVVADVFNHDAQTDNNLGVAHICHSDEVWDLLDTLHEIEPLVFQEWFSENHEKIGVELSRVRPDWRGVYLAVREIIESKRGKK